MTPVTYISENQFLLSCTDKAAKVVALDAIIDALFGQLLVIAQAESPIEEYMLNDGQTTIKTIYRSTTQIMATINALQLQKNKYINSGSRSVRMVDVSNFIGPTSC